MYIRSVSLKAFDSNETKTTQNKILGLVFCYLLGSFLLPARFH